MKPERIFIILTIIGIIALLILSNYNNPIITGEISSIKTSKNSITLEIKNYSEEILIINKTQLPEKIRKGDKVEIYGNKQIQLNKTIIFTDKLICLNCP
jgi:hypothetical protein